MDSHLKQVLLFSTPNQRPMVTLVLDLELNLFSILCTPGIGCVLDGEVAAALPPFLRDPISATHSPEASQPGRKACQERER
jgi:hypothetical protein